MRTAILMIAMLLGGLLWTTWQAYTAHAENAGLKRAVEHLQYRQCPASHVEPRRADERSA